MTDGGGGGGKRENNSRCPAGAIYMDSITQSRGRFSCILVVDLVVCLQL